MPSTSPPTTVSSDSPLTAELELAWQLADIADKISMGRFLANDLQVDTKPDLSPVTEADRAVEQALRTAISETFPTDTVAGEEYGGLQGGTVPAGRLWIIDPIDGTKNYVRGVPVWATLIGLVIDGEPALGLASAPALGRRWWAATGTGSWTQTHLGGAPGEPRKLHVSAVRELGDASFSYSDRDGWSDRTAHGFDDVVDACWRTRAYGDFYSHLLVAEGAVDIAAEPELNPWDVAALIPIVTEAGGRITGYDGSPALTAGGAFTTNGVLHPEVAKLLGSENGV